MNTDNPNTDTKKIPPIWYLALCTGCAVVGMTIITPALPLIKTELQASSDAVQQLLTAYLIALALGQLVCGPLSDKTGRRPILLYGALLFTLAGIATMFTQNVALLISLRFIQGLGAAACMAMGRAIVNDVFARDDAARTMSTISTVLAIAPALSLAFGGVLAESTGWKGIMTMLSVLGIVLLVCTYIFAEETNKVRLQQFNVRTLISAYGSILKNNAFLCWTMAGGMQVGVFFSLNAFLAYQFQRNGYSMAEFGLWFALTPLFYILGNTVNRLWFVSRGIDVAALTGCVLSLVAVTAMYITQALGMTHALSLAIPCALFGFSNGIIIANTTVGAISSAGKHAGTGTGIVGAWQMATGGIAGAIIVALGGDQVFSTAIIALMLMSAIALASMLIIRRWYL